MKLNEILNNSVNTAQKKADHILEMSGHEKLCNLFILIYNVLA